VCAEKRVHLIRDEVGETAWLAERLGAARPRITADALANAGMKLVSTLVIAVSGLL
jgi:hypothetical protein